MTLVDRITEIREALVERRNVSPKNKLVRHFLYGFDNQDKAGKQAFLRRTAGEALPTDPSLEDLMSGKRVILQ